MADPFLIRKSQVAVEEEAVEGTAETLVAADANILVYEPSLDMDISLFQRNPALSNLSTLQGIPGQEQGTLRFRTELKGSGTAGTRPGWGDSLLGCGMQEETLESLTCSAGTGTYSAGETVTGSVSSATATVVVTTVTTTTAFTLLIRGRGSLSFATTAETITGGTSGATSTQSAGESSAGLSYRPQSTSPTSVTVALFQDGMKKQLHGARGTFRVTGEVNSIAFIEFEFQGAYSEVSDTSLLTGITFDTPQPPIFHSAGIKYQSQTNSWLVARSVNIDINNTVAVREDANAAGGIKSFLITDRDPNGTFDPEATLEATNPWFAGWRAGTTGIMEFDVGTSTGNQIQFRADTVQTRTISSEDRTGLGVNSVNFGIHKAGVNTSGDDEFYILHR